MKVRVFNRQGQLVPPVEVAHVVKSDAQWRAQLTPEQYEIARGKGTERAFCGMLLDNKTRGRLRLCVLRPADDAAVFGSDDDILALTDRAACESRGVSMLVKANASGLT